MMAHVALKLFATLSRFTPDSGDRYPIATGTTLKQLLEKLGIPEDDVRLIFINGIKGNLTSTLTDGDRLGIFPPVGGG